ncbi:carbohydrate esterase family 9 protein [Viridothelium virens]|uniref:N-acetylglucosamine-6-phosphate deacetylase n=1 Tax=Viridothelium virens TaxID=1048519 RepID=A0A6A6HGN3_VIRVR|nr:carbohydrate esterase family 9 protein [Viridothelium virens]
MPISTSPGSPGGPKSHIVKFVNCRLIKGNELVNEDLWISSKTGKIIQSQIAFYQHQVIPDEIIDLGGRILAPGFIDVQLNGFAGFSFSVVPGDITEYVKGFRRVNRSLIESGVTSYLPTFPSAHQEVYHKVLPYCGPSGARRNPNDGAESLGAHCEGPFISPTKNGMHRIDVLQEAPDGFQDILECYGPDNLRPKHDSNDVFNPIIKMITAGPELPGVAAAIPDIVSRGIIFSVGHSEATYEQMKAAMDAGSTMVTHLFNAMRPLHHRNPGIFGVLGQGDKLQRPYFGIIADGVHLHLTSVVIAWNAHPDGFILVTDAMHPAGLPDGTYDWTNGDHFIKKGNVLTLNDSETLAGVTIPLIDCVNNFYNAAEVSIPEAIKPVTSTPAKMLRLEKTKGCLEHNADADLVVLSEAQEGSGRKALLVDQVWKFGSMVYKRQI